MIRDNTYMVEIKRDPLRSNIRIKIKSETHSHGRFIFTQGQCIPSKERIDRHVSQIKAY